MIAQTLIVAFLVSYTGSIPPGTINISVMQLSIQKRYRAAVFLALAASLVEFLYAGVTVQFHLILSHNTSIAIYFKVITSVVLIGFGIWNVFLKFSSSSVKIHENKLTGRHGFGRGLALGLLNPMTIPFWLAITTYLENDALIDVTDFGFWAYLIGLSTGTFCLMLTVNALGKRFTQISDNNFLVHKIPGIILIILGMYFLVKLLISS